MNELENIKRKPGRPKGSKNKPPKKVKVLKRKKQKNLNKKVDKKHPGGRPSKFPDIDLVQIEKLASYGVLTLEDIAYIAGIHKDTLFEWMKTHPGFSDSIKKGRAKANMHVKLKLFQRATGYEHPETKFFVVNNEIVERETIKHYPPETAAGIFWLCNQEREKWKRHDKQREIKEDTKIDLTMVAEILKGRFNGYGGDEDDGDD